MNSAENVSNERLTEMHNMACDCMVRGFDAPFSEFTAIEAYNLVTELQALRSPPTEDADRVIAWLGTNLDGESEPFLSERQAEFWSNGASKVEPLYLRAKQPFSERDATNLLSVIADIRAKSGLGVKPMLSELADAIAARIASPRPETVGVSIDELAQEIRRVDGDNSLGAGALAEALMPFLQVSPQEGE